jgi:hypothetical protein
VNHPAEVSSRRPPAAPLAAGVVAVLLLLTAVLPGTAAASDTAASSDTAAASDTAVTAGLVLRLDEVTPRVVTEDGPNTMTVLGTLRNTGDRPVDGPEIRLQRGEALRTDGEVRDALAGAGRTDAVAPDFTPLTDVLAPGAELPIRLTVPLREAPGPAFARPGVYELLVNVNGTPRDGLRARLAATRLLLPVLSLPAGADPRTAPAVPGPPGDAVDVTVLYPLTHPPRRLPTVPGEPALLADDDLARALAPDGRLGGLLAAYAERAQPGSAVRAATCLAVDPDLVATAAAMREGYQVRTANGAAAPGSGAQVAATWLAGLAAAAGGGCVVALPFADADLVALSRNSLGDLGRLAVSGGPALVADVLDTPVLPATWPADGVLDEPALDEVAAAGARAVVLRADAVDGPASPSGVVELAGAEPVRAEPVRAVLADPLLIRAATPGTAGGVAARASPAGVGVVTAAGGALATQDALATLAFRARPTPRAAAGSPAGPTAPGPVVLAPPHRWTTDAAAARALLDGLGLLIDAGELRPRALTDVVTGGPVLAGARRLDDPLQVGARDVAARDVPQPVVETVRELRADVLDLRSAAVAETGVGASVDAVFGPLLQATLRPVSAAWHGRPDLATAAAAGAASRVAQLRESVRVLRPPTPYSLGTRDAPLLLTVVNGLPVTVEVRLGISSTTGLRVAPIPAQRIPPLGRRQVQVDAQVVRSGQFVVEATVRSPAGRSLGPPSRLQVRSTAYGTITVWLTGVAGVLLVVLAARRVVRRLRSEPSRYDRVGPATTGPPRDPAARPPDAVPAERPPRPDTGPPTAGPPSSGRPAPRPPSPGPPRPGPPRPRPPEPPAPEPPTRPVPARR